MEILEHIGQESSIDEAIYGSTDLETAQKTISLARYFLATNGRAQGITTRQLSHKIPNEPGFSESTYHDLYHKIALDKSFQQNFFKLRCAGLAEKNIIAYDVTTISIHNEDSKNTVYRYNENGYNQKAIKILTFYSFDKMLPIAFFKYQGNIPNDICLNQAINELSILGASYL